MALAAEALREEECGTIAALIDAHARERPDATALIQDGHRLDYAGLNRLMNRVATALQRDGVSPGDIIAICAKTSMAYAAVFLGALRAGVAVAPLAPSSTPQSIASMVADCDAKLLFLDETVAQALAAVELPAQVERVALDGSANGQSFATWLAAVDAAPTPVRLDPERAFNIIYSSGTTGEPKGIVHSTRCVGCSSPRANAVGYGAATVTIVSTPLYSNTTLVELPAHARRWRHRRADARNSTRSAFCNSPSSTAPPTPCWCRCNTGGSWPCRISTATTSRASS